MQPLPILYVQNQNAVQALILHYKQEIDGQVQHLLAADAQAIEVDWTNIVTRFVASAVDLFSSFNGDPEQRKAAVIAAATQFYRDVIGPMVAAGVGRPFIFNTIINPAIERLLPKLIGGVYDAISKIFDRKAGVPPTTAPTPAQPPRPSLPGLPSGWSPY